MSNSVLSNDIQATNDKLSILTSALAVILISYTLYLITMFITHLFATAEDMHHEDYYGTVLLAITKVIDEMNGPLALMMLTIILLVTNLVISQLKVLTHNKWKVQIQFSVLAFSTVVIIVQLLLTFELGLFLIGMTLITFGSSIMILGIALMLATMQTKVLDIEVIKAMFSQITKYEWIGFFVLTFLTLPWVFAHLGMYISDFKILGLSIIFIARQEYKPEPSYPNAVHIGTHHGFSAYFMILYGVIAVKWIIPLISLGKIRESTLFITSLTLGYGLYNFIEDFTTEQIYKRDWVDFRLPNGGTPSLNLPTLVIIVLGIIIHLIIVYTKE